MLTQSFDSNGSLEPSLGIASSSEHSQPVESDSMAGRMARNRLNRSLGRYDHNYTTPGTVPSSCQFGVRRADPHTLESIELMLEESNNFACDELGVPLRPRDDTGSSVSSDSSASSTNAEYRGRVRPRDPVKFGW